MKRQVLGALIGAITLITASVYAFHEVDTAGMFQNRIITADQSDIEEPKEKLKRPREVAKLDARRYAELMEGGKPVDFANAISAKWTKYYFKHLRELIEENMPICLENTPRGEAQRKSNELAARTYCLTWSSLVHRDERFLIPMWYKNEKTQLWYKRYIDQK